MKPSLSGRTLLALTGCVWVCLISIEFGVPLDMSSEQARRFDTPITPAGYAFAGIWSAIFLLQGIATLVPWLTCMMPVPAHPPGQYLTATAWPWICGWALEMSWTLTQFLLQRYSPGAEPWPALLLCVGLLLGGHVAMGLALRRAVKAAQQQQAQGAGTASLVEACVLYIVPSGLNCGWLGLATCLGILQVAVACGASYDDMLPWSASLLVAAVGTVVVQPWLLRLPLLAPQPAAREASQAWLADVAGSGYAAPASLRHQAVGESPADAEAGVASASACSTSQTPLIGAGAGGFDSASVADVSNFPRPTLSLGARAAASIVALASYTAAIVWGCIGILAKSPPAEIRSTVLALLPLSLLGGGIIFWARIMMEQKPRARS